MSDDEILKRWSRVENGWWCNDAITLCVCSEKDGWHSYIKDGDTPKNTPCFATMVGAMRDAEKRLADAPKTPQAEKREGGL